MSKSALLYRPVSAAASLLRELRGRFSLMSIRRPTLYALGVAGWAGAVLFGVSRLWVYEGTDGAAARPPLVRPADARPAGEPGLATLIVLIHPRCPCSRATIGELARLMADCDGKLTATVLMLRPSGTPAGWAQTDLWRAAAAIPGVSVRADDEGATAHLFGAATSGQTVLYAADGRLLFAGGITGSRGHSGDNAGRAAITTLVRASGPTPAAEVAGARVYGCPLFESSDLCLDKAAACPQ